jgi:hypothetical protein
VKVAYANDLKVATEAARRTSFGRLTPQVKLPAAPAPSHLNRDTSSHQQRYADSENRSASTLTLDRRVRKAEYNPLRPQGLCIRPAYLHAHIVLDHEKHAARRIVLQLLPIDELHQRGKVQYERDEV